MLLDWFLLLVPVLLLPILLLLTFTGCTVGESSRPELTFILQHNLSVPVQPVTEVWFSWTRDGYSPSPVVVGTPEDPNAQILEFRYQPENTEAGEVWTVTCLAFADATGFDQASCGPFELVSPTGVYTVKFEIVANPQGGQVQVSPGGCPTPS
jgi:hypothetical protein